MLQPKNPEKMTMQEIFDHSARAIIEQGGPAWNIDDKACLYRQFDGNKAVRACAVGHFIQNYEDGFELAPVGVVLDQYDLDEDTIDLFSGLQNAHDRASESASEKGFFEIGQFWTDWHLHLLALAQLYAFDTAVLDEIPRSDGIPPTARAKLEAKRHYPNSYT